MDSCPICRKENQYRFLYDFDASCDKKIVVCECGHQSISPFPSDEELQKIYGESYYDSWKIEGNFRHIFSLKLKTCETVIRQAGLLSASSDKKHLDIGCAFGYMLEAAKLAGYKSQGLEISPAADEALKKGYDVRKISLENAGFSAECFDLITAVDVLEHILKPREWLTDCNRILKKGGTLLLVTPNCSSLVARLKKGKWPHYKVEHVHYYSPATMEKLLLELGFGMVDVKRGVRYLTLDYIANHYEMFQGGSFEAKLFKALKKLLPKKFFEYPFPFISEMMVIAKKI